MGFKVRLQQLTTIRKEETIDLRNLATGTAYFTKDAFAFSPFG